MAVSVVVEVGGGVVEVGALGFGTSLVDGQSTEKYLRGFTPRAPINSSPSKRMLNDAAAHPQPVNLDGPPQENPPVTRRDESVSISGSAV